MMVIENVNVNVEIISGNMVLQKIANVFIV
jgi:hypothetical protein